MRVVVGGALDDVNGGGDRSVANECDDGACAASCVVEAMPAPALVMLAPAQDRPGERAAASRIRRAATRQAGWGSSPCVASPKRDLAPRRLQRQPHDNGRQQGSTTVGNIRCCSSYVGRLEYRDGCVNAHPPTTPAKLVLGRHSTRSAASMHGNVGTTANTLTSTLSPPRLPSFHSCAVTAGRVLAGSRGRAARSRSRRAQRGRGRRARRARPSK